MSRLSVIGTGYLGATDAVGMAALGHDVVGVDTDPDKVRRLSAGDPPFYEPGLGEMLRENIAAGRLRFTTDYDFAADFAEIHFLAVGTPQKSDGYGANLEFLYESIDHLVPRLTRSSIIVGKSTVPVGTASALSRRAKSLTRDLVELEIAWNPEFLREGFALRDTLHPDRIVVGLEDSSSRAELALREVYAPLLDDGVPLVTTDLQTAEMVKVSANAYLATRISFINAMAEVCEAAGADVRVLSNAIGLDPRIGRQYLNAGLGFGGGCIPKDIRALQARAGELGASQAVTFLREVDSINMRQRSRMVELAGAACGGSLEGANVGVLGAAFKPNSDDVRDSPALEVAGVLQLRGANVRVYDPKASENAERCYPTLTYSSSVLAACDGADAVLLLTEWQEFVSLDPDHIAGVVRAKVIVDGRTCLDTKRWVEAGWDVFSLGYSRGSGCAPAKGG
jgi:UDPglucose 6-dehydrogenase